MLALHGAEQVDVQHVDLRRPFGAVGRRAVGRDVERLVVVLRVVEAVRARQVVRAATGSSRASSSSALLLTVCSTGCPSSWPRGALKKLSSASRWQSALPLISASLAPSVGALTGHGVPIASDRFGRSRFSRTPSSASEVERLVLHERPADRAAELLAVEIGERLAVGRVRRQPFERAGSGTATPCTSLVPDLVMTLTTPPAVRPNSALRAGGDRPGTP